MTVRVEPLQGETGVLCGYRILATVDGRTAVAEVRDPPLLSRTVTLFFEKLGPGLQPKLKARRRAVTRQEIKRAEELGGRRQTGSGARPGARSDGLVMEGSDKTGFYRVDGKYRLENKSTIARSFTVKLEDLMKIRSECQAGEVPIYEIEFIDRITHRAYDKWVMVPWDEWKKRARD